MIGLSGNADGATAQNASASGDASDADAVPLIKSEISLVHEIALKRQLSVAFNVINEAGPAHQKSFVTRCECGNLTVEGMTSRDASAAT